MADKICPECQCKNNIHMADCTMADQARDAYLARMHGVRDRLNALGIDPDDLIEFIEFAGIKNNYG